MGTCAGGAVYSPALTDFITWLNTHLKCSSLVLRLSKSATGEVTAEDLGVGAMAHNSVSELFARTQLKTKMIASHKVLPY